MSVSLAATPPWEGAFEQAARAMFGLMADPGAVQPEETVQVTFQESDLELALVIWLNALLSEARQRGLVLTHFKLVRQGDRWMGEGRGQPWRDDLERGVEVKGATLTMLAVCPADGGGDARCVVDV